MINRNTCAMSTVQIFEIFEMFSKRDKINDMIILGIMIDNRIITKFVKPRMCRQNFAYAIATCKCNLMIIILSKKQFI